MRHSFPAPNCTLLDDEACIHAEIDMAALLDGTLAAGRQPSLFQHLMECDICLQALVECMSERQRPAARARVTLDATAGSRADEPGRAPADSGPVRMPRGPHLCH